MNKKDITIINHLLERANNVFVNKQTNEYYLSDGYNSFKYIGKIDDEKEKMPTL